MRRRSFAVALAAIALSAGGADAQLLQRRDISQAQAMKIVQGAQAECRRANMGEITIAVVDRAGDPKLIVAADNSNPHNWELARRKAYTARTFRRTSKEWGERSAGESEQAGQRMLPDVIPLGGGVPITVGNDVVGAVGVSGSTGGQAGDEACARAGIAAIAAELR